MPNQLWGGCIHQQQEETKTKYYECLIANNHDLDEEKRVERDPYLIKDKYI